MKAYSIGETVTWNFDNEKYIIIADKNHPYDGKGASPYNELISVKSNCDYIIRKEKFEGFSPLQHVRKDEIK